MLDYSRAPLAGPPRWVRVISLLGALPGSVSPFLSFTSDTSAWTVMGVFFRDLIFHERSVDTEFVLIAAPFFLVLPISLRQFRLLIGGPARRWENITAICLAGVSAVSTLWFLWLGFREVLSQSQNWGELSVCASGAGTLAAGSLLALWLWRKRNAADAAASVALHTAYLANSAMCLIGFCPSYDAGAWLALVASAALIGEIIVLWITASRR
jgi:hypothetical protein